MAISFIASGTNSDTAGTTLSITGPVITAGDLIIVCVYFNKAGNNAAVISGITGAAGSTYAQAANALTPGVASSLASDIWYAANCSAASSLPITITVSPSFSNIVATWRQYRGAAATGTYQSGANIISSTSHAVVGPAITPAAAGNVLVSIAVNTIINLTGASSPWGNGTSDGTIQGYATGDFLNPALSSQACPFAPNTAIASYVASAAEFNLTGAAPPSNKTNFFLGMG